MWDTTSTTICSVRSVRMAHWHAPCPALDCVLKDSTCQTLATLIVCLVAMVYAVSVQIHLCARYANRVICQKECVFRVATQNVYTAMEVTSVRRVWMVSLQILMANAPYCVLKVVNHVSHQQYALSVSQCSTSANLFALLEPTHYVMKPHSLMPVNKIVIVFTAIVV